MEKSHRSEDAHLVIVNPAAGNGRCGKRSPAALARLRAEGLRIEVRETTAPRDATAIARQGFAEGYRSFVAAGGDGTDFEVLNGILPPALESGERVRLGFLPLGTGNAFLRDFSQREATDYAIASLVADRRRPCDVFSLHHASGMCHFMNLFGVGLAVDTTIRALRLKRYGALGYVAAALETIAAADFPLLPMEVDGELHDQPVAMACICNSQYAAQMKVAPDADITDGLLDLIRVAPMGRLEMVRTFPKIFKGTHLEHPLITGVKAREIQFHTEDEMAVMTDGEVLHVVPRRVEVLQRAVEICA
jgi:YegS/Rv2252/BmrU family lipid kinase